MDNCFFIRKYLLLPVPEPRPREEPPVQVSAPTLDEVNESLKAVSNTTDLNEFLVIIKQVSEDKKSDKGSTTKDNEDTWTSFITSGAKFLKLMNERRKKIEDEKDIISSSSTVVAEILGQIGKINWAIAGLAVLAYTIDKSENACAMKSEALELLMNIVDLAVIVSKLRKELSEQEESLKKAVMGIIQGSIMCVCEIHSNNIFSFLKASVNSETLRDMSKTLHNLYEDLNLTIASEIADKQSYPMDAGSQLLDALKRRDQNTSGLLIDFIYNMLEAGTKDAFLDICCFFDGWLRRSVEYVVGAEEVKSLVEAALVTSILEDDATSFSGEEWLTVHDIVKAKGLRMSASTRFMDTKSFCEAAKDQTKVKGIKGLWFDNPFNPCIVDVKHLNLMRNSLRILHLGNGSRASSQSLMKFKELRCLEILDMNLPMKVEMLDMLSSYFGPLGSNGMSSNKLPTRLRLINVRQPSTSEESSFTENHSLEEMWLWGWNKKQLAKGLDQLPSLKILWLWGYTEMEKFPAQVCKLSSLIKLSMNGWNRLKRLPKSFGELKGLTHLEINGCHELEELPSSFGKLKSLEHLSLQACPKLKQLPAGLESLKYLNVRDSQHLSLEFYRSKRDLKIIGR